MDRILWWCETGEGPTPGHMKLDGGVVLLAALGDVVCHADADKRDADGQP